jgi:hypothetical protein
MCNTLYPAYQGAGSKQCWIAPRGGSEAGGQLGGRLAPWIGTAQKEGGQQERAGKRVEQGVCALDLAIKRAG